jgi:predicted ATPase
LPHGRWAILGVLDRGDKRFGGPTMDHVPTTAFTSILKTILEILRDDTAAASRSADLLLEVAREHGTELYAALGKVFSTWAQSRLPVPQAGTMELRQTIADLVKIPSSKFFGPFLLGLLAKREADAQSVDAALSRVDEALALASEAGERWTDGFLHRLHGDILLKRDLADPGLAEEAYRTAITIAKQQGAGSYELLASLALPKLYQSTSRPSKPTPSSRRRSKALRRRPKWRRSPRRRHCLSVWAAAAKEQSLRRNPATKG